MSGWEPRQYVSYVYDGDRLVGAETVREPEWSTHDRDLVLAQFLWERSLDPNGVPIDEATDPAANPDDYSGTVRFIVGDPVTNWAEKARLDAEDAWRTKHADANMNGLIFTPVKKVFDAQP